jgi:hypothetical protein
MSANIGKDKSTKATPGRIISAKFGKEKSTTEKVGNKNTRQSTTATSCEAKSANEENLRNEQTSQSTTETSC